MPNGTVPFGKCASRLHGKTFLIFAYTVFGRKSPKCQKISQVSEAPHSLNPAWAITWFVSVTIILLYRTIILFYHFLVTIYLHRASFYATNTFEKKLGKTLIDQILNLDWGDLDPLAEHALLQLVNFVINKDVKRISSSGLLFTAKLLQEAMQACP